MSAKPQHVALYEHARAVARSRPDVGELLDFLGGTFFELWRDALLLDIDRDEFTARVLACRRGRRR